MMRLKKNPEIRQDAFIKAATELFMDRGYDAVSIRDVLDAVGDRSTSPSVFYYYFPSKEVLYQSCVQAVAQKYLFEMQEGFCFEGKALEEQLVVLAIKMERSLREERNLILTGKSVQNRLFVLDIRERVTAAVAEMWSFFLERMKLCSGLEAHMRARFLSGGIGELIYRYLLENDRSTEAVSNVMDAIIQFVSAVFEFSDKEKKKFLYAWEEHRKEDVNGYSKRRD